VVRRVRVTKEWRKPPARRRFSSSASMINTNTSYRYCEAEGCSDIYILDKKQGARVSAAAYA
jgi:hypothetical protein